MDSRTIAQLVHTRWRLLRDLVERGRRQREAIAAGRMSELMALLSEKQQPLEQLGETSKRLGAAADQLPDAGGWDSAEDREACLREHEACQQMLAELVELESDCEAALTAGRDAIAKQLTQSEGARRAASGYAEAAAQGGRGERLDLSSH